jgi:hypothetical protein
MTVRARRLRWSSILRIAKVSGDALLKDFAGVLRADGYAGFNGLHEGGRSMLGANV